MAILINKDSRLIIQGITGKQARLHARHHLEYGTNLVGGVTPGRSGLSVENIPVFDTIREALGAIGPIDATLLFTPPYAVLDSALEAIDNGILVIVILTEYVPVHDAMKIREAAHHSNAHVIGPNTIGVISPGLAKAGVMPGFVFRQGRVGIISRSGTLTYETASALTAKGIGQSTCIGIGGDPVPGSTFSDMLKLFKDDPDTSAVILIGEIGGAAEEQAAAYLAAIHYPKPVIAFIAGATAPPEKKMGHAGAIIDGDTGTVASKHKALATAGVHIAPSVAAACDLAARLA